MLPLFVFVPCHELERRLTKLCRFTRSSLADDARWPSSEGWASAGGHGMGAGNFRRTQQEHWGGAGRVGGVSLSNTLSCTAGSLEVASCATVFVSLKLSRYPQCLPALFQALADPNISSPGADKKCTALVGASKPQPSGERQES